MVLYESSNDTLSLRFENVPGAQEIIKSILEAPIEYGKTFQNQKKGKKFYTKEKFIEVVADGLGKKAEKEVVSSEVLKSAGFSHIEGLKFSTPAEAVSEQAKLMR